MGTPEAKREAVRYLSGKYQTSERQACKVVNISRGVQRYRKRPDRNRELRAALYELAMKKPKSGCPLLFQLLKRRGKIEATAHTVSKILIRIQKIAQVSMVRDQHSATPACIDAAAGPSWLYAPKKKK